MPPQPFGLEPLSRNVPFTPYAGGPTGGPRQPSEALIASADEYQRWLGDIDPGFHPTHNHLNGVDFNREVLVAIGLGQIQLGTTVSVDSITLITGGIMGGTAFINYQVHQSSVLIEPVAEPFTVVKCKKFSGYQLRFLRHDESNTPSDATHQPPTAGGYRLTSMYVGEEAVTTETVGEEGPGLTTFLVGEEGGNLTTLRLGEEGLTTRIAGEEDPAGTPTSGSPFGGF